MSERNVGLDLTRILRADFARRYASATGTAVAVAILACAAMVARAGDEPVEAEGTQRVLLFKSGRAIDGRISEADDRYIVVRPVGRVEIPKQQVELIAADFEEVYRYKLRQLGDANAEQQLQLAQWCMLVDLHDRAIERLQHVLELDPDSARARRLLEHLQQRANEPARTVRTSETEPPAANREYRSFQKELTPAQVSTFSVQIQPLLARGCAIAGCHDAAHPGALSLQRSTRPSYKVTHQNLRAVLAQLDPNEPNASPLLSYALRPHGTAPRSPTPIRISDHAFHTLADWVWAVCGKPSGTTPASSNDAIAATTPADAKKPASSEPATDAAPAEKNGGAPAPQSPAEPVAANAPPKPDRSNGAASAISQPRNGTRPDDQYVPIDPFDPEIFNRQFTPPGPRTSEGGR